MLERLALSGRIVAVVSSNSTANVQRILGPESVRLISHFLCGASMFGKAVKLRRVLRLTAIAPDTALYIGDEIRDGEAARDAGIAFGAVGWGMHDEPSLRRQNPAEFFYSVDEIAVKLGA